MRNEIIGFKKSNHAFLRQYERAIPDKLVYLALRNYSGEFLFQTLIQVKAQTIAKWGFNVSTQDDLFIKINGNVIVTLFFCPAEDTANYLAKTKSLIFNHYII
jgi:hypothetical protein